MGDASCRTSFRTRPGPPCTATTTRNRKQATVVQGLVLRHVLPPQTVVGRSSGREDAEVLRRPRRRNATPSGRSSASRECTTTEELSTDPKLHRLWKKIAADRAMYDRHQLEKEMTDFETHDLLDARERMKTWHVVPERLKLQRRGRWNQSDRGRQRQQQQQQRRQRRRRRHAEGLGVRVLVWFVADKCWSGAFQVNNKRSCHVHSPR